MLSAVLLVGCGDSGVDTSVCTPAPLAPVSTWADETWDPRTRTCTGSPPELDCSPIHLGTATPAYGAACVDGTECPEGWFCGGGSCRDGAIELVTLCLEGLWSPGLHYTDGSPPDLRARMSNQVDLLLETTDSCVAVTRACDVVAFATLGELTLAVSQQDSSLTEWGGVALAEHLLPGFGSGDVSTHHVDLGCRPTEPLTQSDVPTMAWVSVWYP